MPLRIKYDHSLRIAAVGPSVWAKLGPEKWFENYKIAVADSREYDKDFVIDLGVTKSEIGELSTQKIIDTKQFIDVAEGELADYRFIVYKPVHPPGPLAEDRFLANDISYAKYEDKKYFREVFASQIPIPHHEIRDINEFLETSAEALYETYSRTFGGRFVIQDNIASGGRGTFVVNTPEDVSRATNILKEERIGTHVVISEFIQGTELSTQTFVSDNYIVRGPLQQQLVRNPELLNPDGRGGVYFCGGRFIYDATPKVIEQAEGIVAKVANELRGVGYQGIFGIDFLVAEDETVVAIEINARTTGLLPLLNEQTVDIPMYLLHILELTKEPYEVIGESGSVITPYETPSGPRSFVTVFNKGGQAAYLSDEIKTGNYSFEDGNLVLIDSEARWNPEADCMIQLFCTDSFLAQPNQKLCQVFLKDDAFDADGTLTEVARGMVQHIRRAEIRP
jgi:hypothetical protein